MLSFLKYDFNESSVRILETSNFNEIMLLELLLLNYFSKKIKQKIEPRTTKVKKYIFTLYSTWAFIYVTTFLFGSQISYIKDNHYYVLIFPAMALSILFTFIFLDQLKNKSKKHDKDSNKIYLKV